MKEIEIKPCVNGVMCAAVYDEKDNTVTILSHYGKTLGYFELEQLNSDKYRWHDLRKNPENLPIYWDLINAITLNEDPYNIIDTSIEECSELIQALSKMKRASGKGLKTLVTEEEAFEMIKEELADVLMCADLLIKILNDGIDGETEFELEIEKIQISKGHRWLQRLGVEET